MARSKYRKLPDLFIRGTECVFPDDTVMWLQAMNPFEVDEARKDANVARARYTLAMKEIGSPEYDQTKAAFLLRGEREVIDDIVESKGSEFFLKATQEIEVDPEWKERVEIQNRSDDVTDENDPEYALLAKVNGEWVAEVRRRVKDESDYVRESLDRLSYEELLDEYMKEWVERRGSGRALAAYNTTETYYAARVCEAAPNEDGTFSPESHASCNHRELVFEAKEEVRELPEEYIDLLRSKLDELAMSIREAKNSPRLLSSSASSQQPSQPVESTDSTPEETSTTAPGT